MGKKYWSYSLLGVGLLLILGPTVARADFLVELTSGRQVTVSHYVDEGDTLKIHTPTGVIGFRKTDVKQITEVGAGQGTNVPLESATPQASSATQTRASDPSHAAVSKPSGQQGQKEMVPVSGGADAAGGEERASGGQDPRVTVERLGKQYRKTTLQHDNLWQKHRRDLDNGASAETLAANRQKLEKLDQERLRLIKDTRRANPDKLPAWAQ